MNIAEIKAMKGAVGMRLEEKGEFKRLQEEMTSLVSKIARLEQKTSLVMKRSGIRIGEIDPMNDNGIVFTASLSSNTFLKEGEILIFDDIQVNCGRDYNPATGVFVAPNAGRYMFSLTARAQYRKQISSEIVLNDKVLGRVTSGYGAIERATSSVTLVTQMKKSDVIFVRQSQDNVGDYHGNGYTAFVGVLLEQKYM